MSKCVKCGDEILTGDIHWEMGLCNNCYNELYAGLRIEHRPLNILQIPKQEDTKVHIWGYELCTGAEWKDFLDVVNKLGKEKTDLEAKLAGLQQEQIKEMQEHQDAMKLADKTIKDLEAKLAESEKKFIVANNLRKNSDEVLLNYKNEKYGLDKTIQELRKIKLSFPEKEWYYKGFENCERQMSRHIADLTLEVKQLKQQLAEQKRVCDWLDNVLKEYAKQEELLSKKLKSLGVDCIEDLGKTHNQEKISFAIEKIQDLKKNLRGKVCLMENDEHCYPQNAIHWQDVVALIDNQIKQLKEGK